MEIVNLIAVAKMKEPFDLDMLVDKLKDTEKSACWVKMRLQPENYYIAFYKSGKFLITGIKDIETADNISKRVVKLLQEAGIDNSLETVEIKNMVMTDKIELERPLHDIIADFDAKSASYEPEVFPAMFYKDADKISYTLFSSGKIVITGVKDIELAKKNLEKFKEIING